MPSTCSSSRTPRAEQVTTVCYHQEPDGAQDDVSPLHLLPLCHLNKPRVTEPHQHPSQWMDDPTIAPSSAGTCPAASNAEISQVPRSSSRASLGTGTADSNGDSEDDRNEDDLSLPIPAIVHGDAAGSAQRRMCFSTGANTLRCSANCKGWPMCRYHLSCLCRVTSLLSPTSTEGPDTLSSAAGSTTETPTRLQVLPPLLWLLATTG